jgi:hypothetical protein
MFSISELSMRLTDTRTVPLQQCTYQRSSNLMLTARFGVVCRVAVEGLLPLQPAAYGLHNLMRRKQLLLARAHSLPGYKEAA